MILDKYEKSSLCMEIIKISKNYGIESRKMSAILTEVIKGSEDESELALFCIAVSECADKYGIDFDVVTTLLAEAIRNREKALSANEVTQTERRSAVVSEKREVRGPQVLYGPPPVREEHYVERVPEPLYGPPPVETVYRVEQMPQPLYGPPPSKEVHVVRR